MHNVFMCKTIIILIYLFHIYVHRRGNNHRLPTHRLYFKTKREYYIIRYTYIYFLGIPAAIYNNLRLPSK